MHKIITTFTLIAIIFLTHHNCFSQANSDSAVFNISTCLNTMHADSLKPEPSGWQYMFINDKTETSWYVKMSYVKPHQQKHKGHTHNNYEIIFILEGSAEITINGKSQTVGPNSSVYYPAHSFHSIKNNGETPLKYLVIKKNEIKPTTQTHSN